MGDAKRRQDTIEARALRNEQHQRLANDIARVVEEVTGVRLAQGPQVAFHLDLLALFNEADEIEQTLIASGGGRRLHTRLVRGLRRQLALEIMRLMGEVTGGNVIDSHVLHNSAARKIDQLLRAVREVLR